MQRDDDLAKTYANASKPTAIVLFRKIIEAIIQSPANEVTESEIKNLREGNMTVAEVVTVLNHYKLQQWLVDGRTQRCVTVGPRVFLELAAMMRNLGVKDCPICSCDVVMGISCRTPECEIKIHHKCGKTVAEQSGKPYSCPTCSLPIEDAEPDSEDKMEVYSSDDE